MFYFDLVRCFGGVPVVVEKLDFKEEATVNQVVYSRKTKAETYAQIEKDLMDAAFTTIAIQQRKFRQSHQRCCTGTFGPKGQINV